MRRIVSGGREIDGCPACGALWFDYGEIKELTEGRLIPGEPCPPEEPRETPPSDPPIPSAEITIHPAEGERPGAFLSRLRREARRLCCPRCGKALDAASFQMSGVPVFRCPGCRGILARKAMASGIAEHFRLLREHGEKYAALGETLAGRERRRMEASFGPASGVGTIPLPVVVPLADEGKDPTGLPAATCGLIAVAVVVYLLAQVRGAAVTLPGGFPGLPSGTGFIGVPKFLLLVSPFLYAGLAPLVTGCLFLYVLGDNVEDRMGTIPYLLLYLFCGVCAGAVHIMWGNPGSAPAMGSSGAVAGILGSYLVFFPNVPVRMYGMGRVATIPAYIFACAWLVATVLFVSPDWLGELFNPFPMSLQGNLAGFCTGVLSTSLWRSCELGSFAG
jgi:membrane associated rhomboid family serine protease/Zn-finger nucleic acid-binding protein